MDVARVLLTTSCTHALELALLALDVREGREVVVPSFTFVSTANAVLRAGGRLVLADIEEDTLGLDPEDVERRLSPKSAVPTRTSVAPSSIATSRSWLMPIESSPPSSRPRETASSRSSRNRRK